MERYHPLKDLAPRDIVSRAIVSEMNQTGSSFVLLDATSIGKKQLRDRFPNIYEFLQNYELDLSVDLIPVSPSAHYWMGGVRTGLNAQTSIAGLFAAGEVACNGVHGANRLASNSLLEGLVFGARAAQAMVAQNTQAKPVSTAGRAEMRAASPNFSGQLRERIRKISWECFGILREEAGMRSGLSSLNSIDPFVPGNLEELELLNLLDCSKLMGSFALQRQESRGSHFRRDYPETNRNWDGHHTLLRDGNIVLTTLLEE
jgi:L-aspartate oxidase